MELTVTIKVPATKVLPDGGREDVENDVLESVLDRLYEHDLIEEGPSGSSCSITVN